MGRIQALIESKHYLVSMPRPARPQARTETQEYTETNVRAQRIRR